MVENVENNSPGIFTKILNFFEDALKINITKSKVDSEIYENFEEMCFNKGYIYK